MSMVRNAVAALVVLLASACQPPTEVAEAAPAWMSGPIKLRVTAAGDVFFNDEPVSLEEVERRFAAIAAVPEGRPEIHLEPDRATQYRDFARVIELATRYGVMNKMGVIGGT